MAEPRPSRMLASSFSQDMINRGIKPGAKVLEHRVGTADEDLARELEEPVGTPVLHLIRLRTADGEPMAVERTALSLHRYPGLEDVDFGENSLYGELSSRWGVTLGMVSASIVAAPFERYRCTSRTSCRTWRSSARRRPTSGGTSPTSTRAPISAGSTRRSRSGTTAGSSSRRSSG